MYNPNIKLLKFEPLKLSRSGDQPFSTLILKEGSHIVWPKIRFSS